MGDTLTAEEPWPDQPAATTRQLRTSLPRARRPARRHRAHQLRQPHPPLHPLHLTGLQLPRRPTPTPRPLLATDTQDRRQDHHPTTHPQRGRALPRLDQQRPPDAPRHQPDAHPRRAKPPNSASPKPASPHHRFNCKLEESSFDRTQTTILVVRVNVDRVVRIATRDRADRSGRTVLSSTSAERTAQRACR